MFPNHKVVFYVFPVRARIFLALLTAYDLFEAGRELVTGKESSIAHAAHLGVK